MIATGQNYTPFQRRNLKLGYLCVCTGNCCPVLPSSITGQLHSREIPKLTKCSASLNLYYRVYFYKNQEFTKNRNIYIYIRLYIVLNYIFTYMSFLLSFLYLYFKTDTFNLIIHSTKAL